MSWLINFIKNGGTLKGAIREFFTMNGRMPRTSEMNKMLQAFGDKGDFRGWTPKVIEGGKSPKKWTDKSGQQWIQEDDGPAYQITEGIGIFDTPYKRMKFDANIKRGLEAKEKTGVYEKASILKDKAKTGLPEFDEILEQEFSKAFKKKKTPVTEQELKVKMEIENKEAADRIRKKQAEEDKLSIFTDERPPKDPEFASGGIARLGFKDGKGVDLNRRLFLQGMGALASVPIVGKFFKWAKPLAKTKDIRVRMKSDMDYSWEGPESGWEGGSWLNLDFVPLTKNGKKILNDLTKDNKIIKDKSGAYYANNSEDGLIAVENIKNKKGGMELETSVHDKVKGSVKGEYDTTKVYSGKDIDSKKILRESSDLATDSPYHDNVFQDEFTEEIINTIKKEKMASGGRAGFDKGGILSPQMADFINNYSDQMTFEQYLQMMSNKMASGGRASFYFGGDVKPDMSDIGHGSDSLMARTRLVSPNSMATTSTGLNYLLAEDNDNTRIPYAKGGIAKILGE